MAWFKDWFNSPYYHILYCKRDEREAELFISNLLSFLKLPKSSTVIDMPCGQGRHSIQLNKLGYKVFGYDLAEESIAYARQFENETLRFGVQDMRFPIEGFQADALLNLFTSFGYFDSPVEDQKAIDAFVKSIKPNGFLVMDFVNMDKTITGLVKQEEKTVKGINFQIERTVNKGFLLKDIRFKDKTEEYYFQEKVRVLYKEDFLNYFNFAGLELIETFGDYQLNAFEKKTSERLILIAKKK